MVERLDGKNYDMWHKKVWYLLNMHKLLDHLTNNMCPFKARNLAQHHRNQKAYDLWLKMDKSEHFTLLTCMMTLMGSLSTTQLLKRYVINCT